MPKKTEREDPLGFSTSILLQNSKKLKGDPFVGNFFLKKVAQCRKNLKGGPFGLVRYCMLRGKPFGSVPWANRYILGSSEFCRTFGRTILVSSGGLKKTLTKSHDYSRLFS